MSDPVIESVAKALKDEGVYGSVAPAKDLARAAVTAHLAALTEAGFVVMPREPTKTMTLATSRFEFQEGSATEASIIAHARECWSDMIDAAERERANPQTDATKISPPK
jgi:DNA-binding transcriptional ArsR family regulator